MKKIVLANKLYHGEEGYNCAQAILKAFQQEFNISEHAILAAKTWGHGSVEGGICGALFAARQLSQDAVFIEHINSGFASKGGGFQCKIIRKKRRLSCRQCVMLAAENINQLLK